MKVRVIRQLKIIMAYIIIFSLVFSLSGLSQDMNVKAEHRETEMAVESGTELISGPEHMAESGNIDGTENTSVSEPTPETENTNGSENTSDADSTSETENINSTGNTSDAELTPETENLNGTGSTSASEPMPETESIDGTENTSDAASEPTPETESIDGTENTSDAASEPTPETENIDGTENTSDAESEPTPESENTTDSAQSEKEYTIGKLKALKRNAAVNTALSVPIYRDYDQSLMGYYSFSGGNIENIEDQVFLDLPYQFAWAEVEIGQGTERKRYHINYYDEINGIEYYGLANESDGAVPDYQIAYELPDDAVVKFIFSLRTNEHRIRIANSLPCFHVEFLYGAEAGSDGEFIS